MSIFINNGGSNSEKDSVYTSMKIGDAITTMRDDLGDGFYKLTTSSTTVTKTNYPDMFEYLTSSSTSDRSYTFDSDSSYRYSSGMYYINGYWIVYYSNNKRMYYTTDITGSWSSVTLSSAPGSVGNEGSFHITYLNGYYILCGGNGIAYSTSINGTWTYKAISSGKIVTDIIRYNGYYVVGLQDYTGSSSSVSYTSYAYCTTLNGTWTEYQLFNYKSLSGSFITLSVINNCIYMCVDYSGALRLYRFTDVTGGDLTYSTLVSSGVYYYGRFYQYNGSLYLGVYKSSTESSVYKITPTTGLSYTTSSYTLPHITSSTYECVSNIQYSNNKFYLMMCTGTLEYIKSVYITDNLDSDVSNWSSCTVCNGADTSSGSSRGYAVGEDIAGYVRHTNGSTKYLYAVYSTTFPQSNTGITTKPTLPKYSYSSYQQIEGLNTYIKVSND